MIKNKSKTFTDDLPNALTFAGGNKSNVNTFTAHITNAAKTFMIDFNDLFYYDAIENFEKYLNQNDESNNEAFLAKISIPKDFTEFSKQTHTYGYADMSMSYKIEIFHCDKDSIDSPKKLLITSGTYIHDYKKNGSKTTIYDFTKEILKFIDDYQINKSESDKSLYKTHFGENLINDLTNSDKRQSDAELRKTLTVRGTYFLLNGFNAIDVKNEKGEDVKDFTSNMSEDMDNDIRAKKSMVYGLYDKVYVNEFNKALFSDGKYKELIDIRWLDALKISNIMKSDTFIKSLSELDSTSQDSFALSKIKYHIKKYCKENKLDDKEAEKYISKFRSSILPRLKDICDAAKATAKEKANKSISSIYGSGKNSKVWLSLGAEALQKQINPHTSILTELTFADDDVFIQALKIWKKESEGVYDQELEYAKSDYERRRNSIDKDWNKIGRVNNMHTKVNKEYSNFIYSLLKPGFEAVDKAFENDNKNANYQLSKIAENIITFAKKRTKSQDILFYEQKMAMARDELKDKLKSASKHGFDEYQSYDDVKNILDIVKQQIENLDEQTLKKTLRSKYGIDWDVLRERNRQLNEDYPISYDYNPENGDYSFEEQPYRYSQAEYEEAQNKEGFKRNRYEEIKNPWNPDASVYKIYELKTAFYHIPPIPAFLLDYNNADINVDLNRYLTRQIYHEEKYIRDLARWLAQYKITYITCDQKTYENISNPDEYEKLIISDIRNLISMTAAEEGNLTSVLGAKIPNMEIQITDVKYKGESVYSYDPKYIAYHSVDAKDWLPVGRCFINSKYEIPDKNKKMITEINPIEKHINEYERGDLTPWYGETDIKNIK